MGSGNETGDSHWSSVSILEVSNHLDILHFDIHEGALFQVVKQCQEPCLSAVKLLAVQIKFHNIQT